MLFVCPAVCLLAQTPPPRPPAPAPQPSVTMSTDPVPQLPKVPPDKVIVTIGDTKITALQFEQIIDSLPEQYRNSARGVGRKQFADSLVRIIVLAEEGKRRKLDENPGYKTQVMFQNFNVLAGITYDRINKDAKIDDAELHKFYEAHKGEFEQVHARHILIRMQGSPLPLKAGQKDLTDAEALTKIQELRTKIVGGADFSQVAIESSDDSGTSAKGGDLGFFRHGAMVPTFEQAAFSMKVGDLSEPVKSQFGYHLIKVEAHEFRSFEDVRPDIERRLKPELAQKTMEELEKKSAVVLDPEYFGIVKQ